MKKYFPALCLLLPLLVFSCNKGEHSKNTKDCPPFTEGPDCSIETRSKYYGTYNGYWSHDTISYTSFDVVLSAGSGLDRIKASFVGAELALSSPDAGNFSFTDGDSLIPGWYVAPGSLPVGQVTDSSFSFTITADDGIHHNGDFNTLSFQGTRK